jgi:hypothetical protein
MRYIRNKDNIYEIVDDYGSSCAVKSRGKRGRTAIDGFTIKYGLSHAPRADSIKELCDEFVAFENGFLRPRLEFKNIDESVLDAFLHCAKIECPNADLFGSIWTKKGLIHVAKINKKGELELL